MTTEAMGFDIGSIAAWAVWVVPFIAALVAPGIGKGSKKTTGYFAVGMSLLSALFAASMLPEHLKDMKFMIKFHGLIQLV